MRTLPPVGGDRVRVTALPPFLGRATGPWLRAERISKRYARGQVALRDVTVELGPGVAVLAGPNGAGKTTLLRILAAVLTPTSGEVYWCGLPARSSPVAHRDIIGYLPQDFRPYPDMTPAGFLSYVAGLKAIPRALVTRRSREILDLVGLDVRAAARRCADLSHGQTRRLGLGQALLNDPHLLLLDEPTTGLDPEGRVEVLEVVRRLAGGKVVVLSTHTLADAGQVADEVLCLDGGLLDPPKEREAFLREAEGHVFEGTVGRDKLTWLRDRPGVSLVAQVPMGGGRSRVRMVTVAETACGPGPGFAPAEPSFEEAYVYRRLLRGAGRGADARDGR